MENSISTAEFHLHTEEEEESTSSASLPPHHHPQMSNGKEKSEEITLVEETEQSRRPNLSSLQIPTRSIETAFLNSTRVDGSSLPSPSSTRSAGLPPRPSSVKFKSMRNLLPQRSFRAKNVVHQDDVEETVLIVPDTLPSDCPLRSTPQQPQRSFSLNKLLFTSSNKTTHSSPVTPVANSGPVLLQERDLDGHSNFPRVQISQHMTRSFSVPVNVKTRSVRRMDSMGGVIRVIPASPRPAAVDADSPNNASVAEIATEDAGEDILEEEAVCRICLVELAEGGDTFRLECSCKGELALAHQECAVKWFSIKGNKSCDVCKQDVRNLPVTLLKIQNPQTVIRRPPNIPQQREVTRYRVWQDVPVLVMVSMLAYFCFLEQLLVSALGPRALAISLPFSCVLGLLSSMIASTLVSKGYLWAFASFQFALVILFAHIFYSILNVNSILSVLLSSFTGFGISISTNSLLVEYLRWRRNRDLQSSHQHGNIDVLPQYYHHQQRQHQQPQEHQQEHRQPQQHHQHNQQQMLENSNMEPANSSMQQETRAHNT